MSSGARILVVVPDDDLRETLQSILQEEGYQVSGVTSLQQALSAVDEQSFHLILADVFVGRSPDSFTEAHILRRHVHPTPLVILTTQQIAQEEEARHKFALSIHMPFELTEMLALIAAQVDHPLNPEQQHQAEMVRRFFAALDANDWDTLKTLCTDDVTFFPPAKMPYDPSRPVRGLDTYLAYVQKAKRFYPDHVTEDIAIYARPKGLAARYQASWRLPNFTTQRLVGTTLFHFKGEHIRQIGVSVNLERLLQGTAALQEGGQAG